MQVAGWKREGFVKKSPGHKNKGTPSRGSTRGPNIIVIGGNQVVIFIQIAFGSDFNDFFSLNLGHFS